MLAESGFFSRCTGEADADRIGAILRVGDVVTIEGAGSIQSGNWLVWNVRHRFSLDSWKMSFTLVRNAMGPAGAGGTLASLRRRLGRARPGAVAMTAADDRALEDLLERLRTRFYGKYRGIVSDVDAATMRIKAKVPSVLGETDTGWCMPCVPYAGPSVGFAFLPETRQRRLDRVRGRRRVLPDLGRRLLARRRVPGRRRGPREGDRHRRPAQARSSTTTRARSRSPTRTATPSPSTARASRSPTAGR